jgi:alpha-ketoglutarate-dependent taurine dioxygenase
MRLTSDAGAAGLPLYIEPESEKERAVPSVVSWLQSERELAVSKLEQHGALLLRGFDVRSPSEFEQVVRAIGADLKKDYLGTSPRNALTDYVFNASELPPFYPIPQHCEMTFIAQPPQRLFFSCLVAPQAPGGETPICDFRRVYRDLDPAVRERFTRLGVRNIRNYGGPNGRGRFDLWQLKPWHEMFGTTDRAVVEQKCREAGFEWTWGEHDKLRLTNTQPAARAHPKTGELVWFNHSQVFHLSAAQGEYRRILSRLPMFRYEALRRVAEIGVFLKRLRGSSLEHPMHSTYGDGSEIPDSDMERVRDAIWRNLVVFRWQVGDVLMIDNFGIAHGRMPYRGPRHVIVCWE